jgi:hypothetical protein
LISQALATGLGLEVQPPGENNILIDFDDHQEGTPSVGIVTLEWRSGKSASPLFRVRCYVCAREIRFIILGRTFFERLGYYQLP